MCGGDDHLAWKHFISLEACKGLRTIEGYDRFCQGSFNPPILSYRAVLALQVNLNPIKISSLHVGAFVDLQSCLGHSWVQLSSPQSSFGVLKNWHMFEFQLGHLFCIVVNAFPPLLSFLHVISLFVSLYLIGALFVLVWIQLLRSELEIDRPGFQSSQVWILSMIQLIDLQSP